jgi:WD40 repeat protein
MKPQNPYRPPCPSRHCEARSNPLTQLFNYSFKSYVLALLLSCGLLFSCTTDNDIVFGSILFSSNADCTVRIFDTPGNQLVRVEVPHDTTVSADMKHKGIFIVHAVSAAGVVKKKTVLFEGGVVDCFIFFDESKK